MNHYIIAAIIAVAVLGAAYLLTLGEAVVLRGRRPKRKVNPPTLEEDALLDRALTEDATPTVPVLTPKPKAARKPRHGKRRHK